jgi:hypothetical protein
VKTDYEKQISRILKEFDFEKVRKVMCALDWTWRDEPNPPTVPELVRSATRLLIDVSKDVQYGMVCACGGFETRLDFNGDLHLRFVIEEWDGSDYTNGVEDDASS